MKLILVRHGHPDYTTDTLTSLGIRQAEAAAVRLKDEGITEIHASSSGRAYETAGYTAKALGLPITAKHEFIREMNWQVLEGCDTPSNGHPWMLADKLMTEGYDLLRKDWGEVLPFVNTASPKSVRTIGDGFDGWLADSFGYERVGNGYRYTGTGNDSRVVALFSHAGSSTAALSRLLSLPFPYLCAVFRPDFTAITVLTLSDDGCVRVPSVDLMLDARHIRGITADPTPQN